MSNLTENINNVLSTMFTGIHLSRQNISYELNVLRNAGQNNVNKFTRKLADSFSLAFMSAHLVFPSSRVNM